VAGPVTVLLGFHLKQGNGKNLFPPLSLLLRANIFLISRRLTFDPTMTNHPDPHTDS
jgi:hypothetical protein